MAASSCLCHPRQHVTGVTIITQTRQLWEGPQDTGQHCPPASCLSPVTWGLCLQPSWAHYMPWTDRQMTEVRKAELLPWTGPSLLPYCCRGPGHQDMCVTRSGPWSTQRSVKVRWHLSPGALSGRTAHGPEDKSAHTRSHGCSPPPPTSRSPQPGLSHPRQGASLLCPGWS